MTNDLLDLIEFQMGAHKGTAAAQAARAVLVGGSTRPQAQEQYGITRATLSNAINKRLQVLETAKKISDLSKKHLTSANRAIQ